MASTTLENATRPFFVLSCNISNNKILEQHGKVNHPSLPGNPNSIPCHPGQTNPSQELDGQIHNALPPSSKIQLVILTLHSGLLPPHRTRIGLKTGSALWG